ncbi:MAG: hypothetical protein LWX07_06390 [Bacteroidetes bacterium]|nr:hypothetical protein [Bacteroidota bacterium]
MKKHIINVLLFVLSAFVIAYGQDKYLEKGNMYLNNEEFGKAEKVFRDALIPDSTNLIYRCQLGLSLLLSEKYSEAEKELDIALSADSNNIAAVWYYGLCNFNNSKYKNAVLRFEKALTLLNKSSGQYYSANWYIGTCYSILLKTDGLSYKETDRMFECYEEYLRLQPNAEDSKTIKEYVEREKKRRPPRNVEKWIDL